MVPCFANNLQSSNTMYVKNIVLVDNFPKNYMKTAKNIFDLRKEHVFPFLPYTK